MHDAVQGSNEVAAATSFPHDVQPRRKHRVQVEKTVGGNAVQTAGTALAFGMTISRKLLGKLDRASLPREVKDALRASLEVLLDDLDDWHADKASFNGMLAFMTDHTSWVAPALSITTEGFFKLMWEVPGSQWILDFLPSGQIQWTMLKREPDGRVLRKEGRSRSASISVPFEVPLRHQPG